TSCLLHRHHFQQVPAGILKIKPAAASSHVDLVVCVTEWPAAVRNTLRLHTFKNRIKLRIANVERIVMALDRRGVKIRLTTRTAFVSEIECQAVVDLDLREVTRLYR